MKNNLVLTIIVSLIVGVVGFYAGMKYQQSQRPRLLGDGQFGSRQGGATQQNNRAGFRPVNGEIIEQDEKSITVKLQDGSSKIVFLSDTTTINKSSEGDKKDLKIGEKIGVIGLENSDGSVTAQTIQLNPIFRNQNSGAPKQ